MCIIFVIDVLSSSNSPPISYWPKKSRRSKGHLPNYESIHLLFIIHTILCLKGFINFILIQKILGNDILCHRLQISFAIRKVYFRGFFRERLHTLSWKYSCRIWWNEVWHYPMLNFCEIEYKYYLEFYFWQKCYKLLPMYYMHSVFRK